MSLILWGLLVIYGVIVIIASVYFNFVGTPLGFVILMISIGIFEIPMLQYIENRKVLDWFKKNKDSLKKYNSVIQLK